MVLGSDGRASRDRCVAIHIGESSSVYTREDGLYVNVASRRARIIFRGIDATSSNFGTSSNFTLKKTFSSIRFLRAPGSQKNSPWTTIWPNSSPNGSWIDHLSENRALKLPTWTIECFRISLKKWIDVIERICSEYFGSNLRPACRAREKRLFTKSNGAFLLGQSDYAFVDRRISSWRGMGSRMKMTRVIVVLFKS